MQADRLTGLEALHAYRVASGALRGSLLLTASTKLTMFRVDCVIGLQGRSKGKRLEVWGSSILLYRSDMARADRCRLRRPQRPPPVPVALGECCARRLRAPFKFRV